MVSLSHALACADCRMIVVEFVFTRKVDDSRNVSRPQVQSFGHAFNESVAWHREAPPLLPELKVLALPP